MLNLEQKGSTPEPILRERALFEMQNVHKKKLSPILNAFKGHGLDMGTEKFLDTFRIEVKNAQRSTHWGSEDSVMIGYYNSEAIYYTLFFHELTHRFLEAVDNGSVHELNQDVVEAFCYEVSEMLCKVLHLPYDKSIEMFAMSFHGVSSLFGDGLSSLQEKDPLSAYILGYHDRAMPNFIWNEVVAPVVSDF